MFIRLLPCPERDEIMQGSQQTWIAKALRRLLFRSFHIVDPHPILLLRPLRPLPPSSTSTVLHSTSSVYLEPTTTKMAANPGDLNASVFCLYHTNALTCLYRFKAANLPNTTDFTIRLGRHQWQVHSKIVSEASQFFRVACTGNFKVGQRAFLLLHVMPASAPC